MTRVRSIRLRTTLLYSGLVILVIIAFAAAAHRQIRQAATLYAKERLAVVKEDLVRMMSPGAEQAKAQVLGIARDPAVLAYLRESGSVPSDSVVERLAISEEQNVSTTELRDASAARLLVTDESIPPVEGTAIGAPVSEADSVWLGPMVARGDTVYFAAVAPVRDGASTIGQVVRWRRLATPADARDLIGDLIGSSVGVYLANASGDLWTDGYAPIAAPSIPPGELLDVAVYERPDQGSVMASAIAIPGSPWFLVVEFPGDFVTGFTWGAMRRLLLWGALLLLAGGVMAWWVSGRLTSSVEELAGAAKSISRGDYSHRVNISGRDEVAALGRSFNSMVENIASARAQLEDNVRVLAVSEEANRDMRQRLENVISSSPAILYEYRLGNGEGRLEWISDNVRWLLGYTVEDALEPGWWSRNVHPMDREAEGGGQRTDEGEGGLTREYRFRHADGHYRWLRDERRVVKNGEREAFDVIGVFSDVTDRRRLEMAKGAAEAANQAKSEFLSRMSHELRTPLTAILGFGQLLAMETESDENRESVRQILKAGGHLLSLINEVLDIARIEEGRMSLSVEPVPVVPVIRESLDLVRLMAADQGIAISMRTEGCLDCYVLADQQRLKQVLLNILSNGIKYNRREGTVAVLCEHGDEGHLRIVVQDSGFGIPAEKLVKLFTPFERLGAESTGVEGTGLGLALCKGLIEAMGGRLGVQSIEGRGSRFWVELPLTRPPELGVAEPKTREVETARIAGSVNHTILYVEDNLANVRLMERILARTGDLHLVTAMQGRMGLEIARSRRPNLILLDLNLPDLPGDQVLRQLRQDPELRDIPVIMISGDATPSHRQRLTELGARAFVSKPFDVALLLRLIDEILRVDIPDIRADGHALA